MLENPKLRYRFNNYKSKHRGFRKGNRKIPQKLFHDHYCLDGHLGYDDWDYILFEQCETNKQLKERETFWQDRFKAFYPLGLDDKEEHLYQHLNFTSLLWPCYIILQYIILLNCIMVDYFILLCHYYLSSIVFLLFSFYFHFYSPISFTFTLQTLFDLLLHFFCLVFVLLHLLSFLSIFIPLNRVTQKCGVKTNSFILFFLQAYMKIRFNFFVFSLDYCFLRGHILNFT